MAAFPEPAPRVSAREDEDPLSTLSAVLDGEAGEAQTDACLEAMKRDEVLRRTWAEYHLVGEMMRGAAPLQEDFMSRFSARLAAEPTVLAPRRSAWPQRVAVASLASLAVWGVVSLTGQLATDSAQLAAPATVVPASGVQQAAGVRQAAESPLAAYLVAHQEVAAMAATSPFEPAVAVAVEAR